MGPYVCVYMKKYMYSSIYIYIHQHVYTCIYLYIYTHIEMYKTTLYIYTHVDMYNPTLYIYTHIDMYNPTLHIYTHIDMSVPTNICIHLCIYAHIEYTTFCWDLEICELKIKHIHKYTCLGSTESRVFYVCM